MASGSENGANVASPESAFNLSQRLRALCASFNASGDIDCQLLVIPDHAHLPPLAGAIVLPPTAALPRTQGESAPAG